MPVFAGPRAGAVTRLARSSSASCLGSSESATNACAMRSSPCSPTRRRACWPRSARSCASSARESPRSDEHTRNYLENQSRLTHRVTSLYRDRQRSLRRSSRRARSPTRGIDVRSRSRQRVASTSTRVLATRGALASRPLPRAETSARGPPADWRAKRAQAARARRSCEHSRSSRAPTSQRRSEARGARESKRVGRGREHRAARPRASTTARDLVSLAVSACGSRRRAARRRRSRCAR
jgi:hypothetical protein